ncbi:desmoglein-2-like [Polypterus senegalus]|uniref:desmoglein-2-like n=1 Tax=Polypterus senegalus TaxID=55291 RepID=UPI0019636532|nr:desmoglein-2-like [Polypterus senegalus]
MSLSRVFNIGFLLIGFQTIFPSYGKTTLETLQIQNGEFLHNQNINNNQRQKRDQMTIPPIRITENEDYTSKNPLTRIRSDVPSAKYYKISGKGANEPPFNVFVVNENTGEVSITGIVDREKCAIYSLVGYALNSVGKQVEHEINVVFIIDDVNDNAPVFSSPVYYAEVPELSTPGTVVFYLNATDADDPDTIHTKLVYQILDQQPSDGVMFYIEKNAIMVAQPTLDREEIDHYTLIIQVKDMDGGEGFLSSTATVQVDILDVNDNLPIMEKDSYEGSVEENAANVEVMRMKAFDADLEGSANWEAEYHIDSGNEGGYFRMETDAATNEGILILQKEMDYEELQNLQLGISVRNKAAFHQSLASASGYKSKSIPVNIKVKNKKEGAAFMPKVKAMAVSEQKGKMDLSKAIGSYRATDRDSGKFAQNVKYAKGNDPGNWLSIDPNTAEIRLNQMPDRESPYLKNGTYTATILAISDDMPAKTSTGTIAIQVEDFNDHCPTLTTTSTNLCTDEKSIVVTAVDQDFDPNGPPFKFAIVNEPNIKQKQWTIEKINDTSAVVRIQQKLWPGDYSIKFMIEDQQGKSCENDQVLNFGACTCDTNKVCASVFKKRTGTSIGVGPLALVMLMLGPLLLLFVPLLLLACICGNAAGAGAFKKGIVEDATEGRLMKSASEGIGEDKDIEKLVHKEGYWSSIWSVQKERLLMDSNVVGAAGAMNTVNMSGGQVMHQSGGSVYSQQIEGSMNIMNRRDDIAVGGEFIEQEDEFDIVALPDHLLKTYYMEKARNYSEEPEDRIFKFSTEEDKASVISAVDICRDIDESLDNNFLNNLGPKFKTLAGICTVNDTSEATYKDLAVSVEQSSMVSLPAKPSGGLMSNQKISTVHVKSQVPPPIVQQDVSITEKYSTTTSKSAVSQSTVSQSALSQSALSQSAVNLQKNVLVSDTSSSYVPQTMYYATTPVIQATRYIVEPQIQPNVLIADRGQAIVTGLHGPVRVAESLLTQNVLLTDKRVITTPVIQSGVVGIDSGTLHMSEIPVAQNLVLVDRYGNRIQGGVAGLEQGTLRLGEIQGSKNVLITEQKVLTGASVQSNGIGLDQSTLHMSAVPSSQNVLRVEKRTESIPVLQSMRIGGDPASVQTKNIVVKEKTVVSGPSKLAGVTGFNHEIIRMTESLNNVK